MSRSCRRVVAGLAATAFLLTGCSNGQEPDAAPAPSASPAAAAGSVTKQLRAVEGGTVANAAGVSLSVPAGAMTQDGAASITPLRDGSYDVHISVAWAGKVQVGFRDPGTLPYLMHKRAGGWALEPARRANGQLIAVVSTLSPFDVPRCLLKLRPSAGSAIMTVKCLLRAGVKMLPAAIAKQIGKYLVDYDGCRPVSLTNWTLDALEILIATCKAGEGDLVGSDLSAGNADGSDLGTTHNPQPGTSTGGTTGGGSGSTTTGGTTGSGSAGGSTGGSIPSGSGQISLTQGSAATQGSWYAVTLTGWNAGAKLTVSCHDSKDASFYTQTFTIDGNGKASDSTLCYSADGPDHWVTGGGVSSNHVSWGGAAPPPPPTNPAISLSQGGAATAGYWYSVHLSGWRPGSQLTVSCHDSKDASFYTQTFTIDGNGNAGDSTLCYSADGPDHWVTGGGVSSNHVSWGGAAPPPPPAPSPKITLAQGGAARYGYWYAVTLSGFSPGSQVTVSCRDSVDPGGFYSQTFTIDGNGNAGDSTLCYSGDHPDHWVTGAGVESNHVSW
jgi:hypothetical protein